MAIESGSQPIENSVTNNSVGKGLVADVHGNSMSPGDDEHRGAHNDTSPQLTREQYAQFLELLQQLQVQKHGDTNSNTLLHTSPNHSTNLPTAIQPPNSILTHEPLTPTRPSRSHKLPIYLQDYVLSKNMKVAPSVDTSNQLQNSNISLNAAFSKHQHIPLEVLADESQALAHVFLRLKNSSIISQKKFVLDMLKNYKVAGMRSCTSQTCR
ncbi:hypothetical protein H5410_038266 [Solanum commersonii]|uniref:Uncharacterized protein n=1 Tax=Solanum commersonii TaxID=4109 RepID=A0A9J5YA85_SOLCO|nr:hypothetical protein H5410_038266 [Solanum commersonii]